LFAEDHMTQETIQIFELTNLKNLVCFPSNF